MIKAELKGREALTRHLNKIAPKVEEYAAKAKLEIAQEAAAAIARAAPRGDASNGDSYAASIHGDFVRNFPRQEQMGINTSKDKDATGIVGGFIWRFLEFGTKGHIIKARGGKRLVFRGANGRFVSAKQVKHPDTNAQPHIFPTWRAMKIKARRKLLAAVNKGVKEAMGRK